jgi:hypothetical protein
MQNFVKLDEEIDSLVNKEISCWKNDDEKGMEFARADREALEKERQELQLIHGNVPYPATVRGLYSTQ